MIWRLGFSRRELYPMMYAARPWQWYIKLFKVSLYKAREDKWEYGCRLLDLRHSKTFACQFACQFEVRRRFPQILSAVRMDFFERRRIQSRSRMDNLDGIHLRSDANKLAQMTVGWWVHLHFSCCARCNIAVAFFWVAEVKLFADRKIIHFLENVFWIDRDD